MRQFVCASLRACDNYEILMKGNHLKNTMNTLNPETYICCYFKDLIHQKAVFGRAVVISGRDVFDQVQDCRERMVVSKKLIVFDCCGCAGICSRASGSARQADHGPAAVCRSVGAGEEATHYSYKRNTCA